MHRAHGVEVHCDSIVTRIVGDDRLEGVELSSGKILPAGSVVVGLGVAPTVEWLADSGIDINNGIVCDASGHTSIANVYAVGDVAHWASPYGHEGRHEHWTSAVDQARVVAANIVGSDKETKTILFDLPYFWSDLYGVKLQALGWPSGSHESTAIQLGSDSDKLVVLYSDAGRFVGVVGIGAPRIVMGMRTLLKSGASLDDALDKLSAHA